MEELEKVGVSGMGIGMMIEGEWGEVWYYGWDRSLYIIALRMVLV